METEAVEEVVSALRLQEIEDSVRNFDCPVMLFILISICPFTNQMLEIIGALAPRRNDPVSVCTIML